MQVFFLFFYILRHRWRSNYQKGWDAIRLFYPNLATFLCLPQARTWISNAICRALFVIMV